MSRWETSPLDPLSVGFEMQLQSTALQNELQSEIKSRALTPNQSDETGNVTVMEQQISKL